ncbi:methyltransferase domain-containing protein [Desulfoluna spongiiphila]|nr:methyltransferase domain-containing protein [Desulfoluna spongiiphila]
MKTINNESFLMKVLKRIGLERNAWSLRRLYCPVDKKAFVLEVGSGGNPYARSNVLLDAYEETRERHWAPLVYDRPTVIGFVEKLPFPDKSFDFVIASHVLEHSSDPAKFLSELQRVAKAGYIEVPDAFMERVNPYRDHRLEVTVRDGELIIRKKSGWMEEPSTVELYEERVKQLLTRELIPRHPFSFHVRFYWEGKIPFRIVNPDTDSTWEAPASVCEGNNIPRGDGLGIRNAVLEFMRKHCSQNERNKKITVSELLKCPECSAGDLTLESESLVCQECKRSYSVNNGIPMMYS